MGKFRFFLVHVLVSVAAVVLLSGCTQIDDQPLYNSLVSPSEAISLIMDTERNVDSVIEESPETETEDDLLCYQDDLYVYQYHPDGYMAIVTRLNLETHEQSEYAEPSTAYEARASQLFLRNFNFNENHTYTVSSNNDPMNQIRYEITETISGHPTGRSMSIAFSGDGTVYSISTYCKPVPIGGFSDRISVSEEEAIDIAFDQLMEDYGAVLETTELEKTHWTAEKGTYESKTVWIISFTDLSRMDWDPVIRGNWCSIYYISTATGEIVTTGQCA